MYPVLTEVVAACAICDEIACERDLLYVETPAEADRLGVPIGAIVCTECA